jgi:hypothetical protein
MIKEYVQEGQGRRKGRRREHQGSKVEGEGGGEEYKGLKLVGEGEDQGGRRSSS